MPCPYRFPRLISLLTLHSFDMLHGAQRGVLVQVNRGRLLLPECGKINLMWFFRHKKRIRQTLLPGPTCSSCGSTNTRLIVYHGSDHPNHIRMWRGQRSFTYRCLDCGVDFYGEEPREEISDETMAGYSAIDDEEALSAAEEEVKKQAKEDGDRRWW